MNEKKTLVSKIKDCTFDLTVGTGCVLYGAAPSLLFAPGIGENLGKGDFKEAAVASFVALGLTLCFSAVAKSVYTGFAIRYKNNYLQSSCN